MATREWDQTAAEALILDHLPDVVTLCNRLFAQQSDADDAAHEAVLAVLRLHEGMRVEARTKTDAEGQFAKFLHGQGFQALRLGDEGSASLGAAQVARIDGLERSGPKGGGQFFKLGRSPGRNIHIEMTVQADLVCVLW